MAGGSKGLEKADPAAGEGRDRYRVDADYARLRAKSTYSPRFRGQRFIAGFASPARPLPAWGKL